jgi:hypothetical protein
MYCGNGDLLFMAGSCMNRQFLNKALTITGAFFALSLLIPSYAAAHLVTTGMGPVYDGIGHLLLTPEDLVPSLAVALYAGLRGKSPGRCSLSACAGRCQATHGVSESLVVKTI